MALSWKKASGTEGGFGLEFPCNSIIFWLLRHSAYLVHAMCINAASENRSYNLLPVRRDPKFSPLFITPSWDTSSLVTEWICSMGDRHVDKLKRTLPKRLCYSSSL